MKILALEFSSHERSVAVAANGEILALVRENDFKGVTSLALIDRALSNARVKPAEISALAVGLGPGSYTGIRSSLAIAQGWQLGRNVKLVGISSISCVAEEAKEQGIRGRVSIIVDAQRTEIYLARYEIGADQAREMEPLQIVPVSQISPEDMVLGPEATRFVGGAKNLAPSAATLARLALAEPKFVPGEELEPIYLRQTTFVKAPPPRHIA